MPDDEGIINAVYTNLEEITHTDKDVVLEVYSHEDPFSIEFIPQVKEMAKLLSKNKNIQIAKIDILLNEIPFNVPFTPAFFLFKKG